MMKAKKVRKFKKSIKKSFLFFQCLKANLYQLEKKMFINIPGRFSIVWEENGGFRKGKKQLRILYRNYG